LAFFGLEFAWISCACIKTGKQTQDFFWFFFKLFLAPRNTPRDSCRAWRWIGPERFRGRC